MDKKSGQYNKKALLQSKKEVLDELRLHRGVERSWEITCINALAQDWIEHRPGNIIRRELAAVTGERVGEVVFRVR